MNIWLFLIALIIILFSLTIKMWLLIPIFILAIYMRAFNFRSMNHIFIGGVFIFTFFDFGLTQGYFSYSMAIISSYAGYTVEFTPISKFLIVIASIAFFFIHYLIQKNFIRDHFAKIGFILTSFCLLMVTARFILLSNIPYGIFFAGLLLFSSKVLHYYIYTIQQLPNGNLRQFSVLVFPTFWDFSHVPRGKLELESPNLAKSENDKKAFIYLITAVIATLIANAVSSLAWGYPFFGIEKLVHYTLLPDIRSVGFDYLFIAKIERWKIFLSIYLFGIRIILTYFCFGLVYNMFYQIIGYPVPLQFLNPFKAKNFGGFINCLMPYYIQFIHLVFIYPLYSRLRKIISKKTIRYEVSLFLGILVGGFVHHFVRDQYVFFQFGLFNSICTGLRNSVLYFGGIYAVARVFTISTEGRNFVTKAAIFLIWTFVFSLLFTLRVLYPYGESEMKLNFYLYLFGIL